MGPPPRRRLGDRRPGVRHRPYRDGRQRPRSLWRAGPSVICGATPTTPGTRAGPDARRTACRRPSSSSRRAGGGGRRSPAGSPAGRSAAGSRAAPPTSAPLVSAPPAASRGRPASARRGAPAGQAMGALEAGGMRRGTCPSLPSARDTDAGSLAPSTTSARRRRRPQNSLDVTKLG